MKYKTKIPSWLPLFSGFYDNWMWEPDFEYEAEYLEEQYGYKGELWDKFDYQKWRLHISKKLCDVVEELLSDFVTRIDFEHLKSPKFYNFETDAINCTFKVKPKAIREYLYANKEAFANYIKERYTSRSGFNSWFSNDIEDWEAKTSGFKDLNHKHECGAILNFIAINEGLEEVDLYQRMVDKSELNVGEFYEEGFWDTVDGKDGAAEFVRNNYLKDNLLNLLFENFDPKILDLEGIMYKTMREIESHTLELKFKK